MVSAQPDATEQVYDFYVSFPDTQRERARKLAVTLEEGGFRTFIDEKTTAGTDWVDAMARALQGARTVLVLVDESSPDREFQPSEIRRALELMRRDGRPERVVPILVGEGAARALSRLGGLAEIQGIPWPGNDDAAALASRLLTDLDLASSLVGVDDLSEQTVVTDSVGTVWESVARIEGRDAFAIIVAPWQAITVSVALASAADEVVLLLPGTSEPVRASIRLHDSEYGFVLLNLERRVGTPPARMSRVIPPEHTTVWASVPELDEPFAASITQSGATLVLESLSQPLWPGAPLWLDGELLGIVKEDFRALSSVVFLSDHRVFSGLEGVRTPTPPLRWVAVAGTAVPSGATLAWADAVGAVLAEAEPPVGLIVGGFPGVDDLVARAFVTRALESRRFPHVRVVSDGQPKTEFLQRARHIEASRNWSIEYVTRADLVVMLDGHSMTGLEQRALEHRVPLIALPSEDAFRTATVMTEIGEHWAERRLPGLEKKDYDAMKPGDLEPQLEVLRTVLGAVEGQRPRDDQSAWVNDTPVGVDRLDRKTQAELFARGIVSSELKAPFAIGLFGDWGSGKSHFMGLMKAAMTDNKSVCQIDFNAWHYMDANPWISIAGRIFDGLAKALGVGKEVSVADVRRRLRARLMTSQEAKAEAEKKKKKAEEALEASRQAVAEADDAQKKKLGTLVGALTSKAVWGAIAEETGVKAKILDFTIERLGIEQEQLATAVAIPDEARRLREQLLGTTEGVRSLARAFVPGRRAQWVLGLIVFAVLFFLPPLFDALSKWLPWLSLETSATQLVTIAITLTAVVRTGLSRITAVLGLLDSVREQGEAVRRRVFQKARKEPLEAYDKAQLELQQARERHEQLAKDVAEIEAEIDAIEGGRLVRDFLEEKTGKESFYRKSEGTVSLIRRDLIDLKAVLEDWRSDPESKLPAIKRIVLYIDDLDRCPAPRVVQVLQAVHLLLAIDDLFVVVVGVDSRWLTRSLLHGYEELLQGASRDDDGEGSATAEDYLQKIFQIPFTLPSIQQSGFESLVGAHVKVVGEVMEEPKKDGGKGTTADAPKEDGGPVPPKAEGRRPDDKKAEENGPTAAPAQGGGDGASSNPESAKVTGGGKESTSEPEPTPPSTDPRQAGFVVEEWERAFMTRHLKPFLHTPRLIKRFINIYRLLRSGVEDSRLDAFRLDAREGEHRVMAVLLAINVGFPHLGARLLGVLSNPTMLKRRKVETWAQVVGLLDPPQEGDADAPDDLLAGSGSSARRRRLRRLLDELQPELPSSLTSWTHWAPKVGRYSMYWSLR